MERLQASASHQPRIDDKTRNNVEISPPSRQSNSMCHDRSNNTMIEEKKSDSCRDGEMIDASDEDNRKPMDPYKELELYLARVIEEIDDIIIVKAPSTPLNRHRETDFSSKQSQINSNLDIANETCSNDRSLLDPSSLTIGASLNTRKSENVKLRQYPECWDERSEICKSERSAERLKNSKPLVVSCQKIDTPVTKTIPRRNNTIDDRVIDYKELLNEFGLSDSESAESESPGDNFMKKLSRDSTNGEDQSSIEIANKNILVPPKSMEMGITASYMLNPNYQEPEDLLVRGETKFSKIHHFPEKFDESHEVDALNEGEEKLRREASMLSNGSKCETSLIISSSSDELKNSSSLAKCSKRSRQMSRGRTSGCEIISVLPKNNRPVDLTITCENKDEKPRRFEDERKKETENRTIAAMSSSSLINGSNYNRIIDKSLSNRSSEITKKLPPRQQQESRGKRVNLPTSPMTQKRRRFLQGKLTKSGPDQPENPIESLQPDYDDIFIINQHEFVTRSKSLECPSSPRSAPVTPTDDKRLAPFSKILRKRHTPVFRERSGDAILVRVSSLPDQDLVDLTSNERSRENSISKSRNNSRESSSTRITRAISPLTLRSDLTAKRLSESDKDVSQISPVELKKFSSSRRTSVNDASVGCDLTDSVSDGSNEIARSMEKLKNVHLAKGIAALDENNSRSGSLPISLQSLFSRLRNGSGSCCPSNLPIESFVYTDIATQTSPAISPSSSFTWVSDCESPRAESQLDAHSLQEERALLDRGSPQDTVDDDNRSSSSSQDLLQSMDEISSGSISPDTNDRASPLESGIGTASPPRSTDRRLVKPSTGKKCHRKETWERIRRRPSKLSLRKERGSTDVWVRRESVHTQTRENEVHCCQDGIDSSSGLDDTLPRIKASRPTNLPLAICITGSSSLSSAELIDTLPRAPSSPSAASLQLKHEPLNIELGSKSNSAPLLENKEPGMDNRIKPIPRQPRSQSERQLSEIEAQEACKWLRAAGFPQYAQMYEDYQFPIDVSGVAKDHPFLEADSLQSLFRRLHALNRCANMKLDTHHHSHHHNTNHDKSARGDDSDEDTQCALSENWTFEKKTRRWSRVGQVSQANVERLHTIGDQTLQQPEEDDYMDEDRRRRHCRHRRRRCVDTEEAREAKENAEEEEEEEDDAEEDEEEEEEEREGDAEEDADDTMTDSMRYKSLPMGGGGEVPGEVVIGPRFRRTGSERLRDGAKAFLRRVESLKSRRRKRQNREGVVISGPQVLDVMSMEKKMKDLNCIDVSSGRSTGIIDHHQPQPPPISSLGHTLPPYSPSNLLPSRDSSPFNLAISGITNIHNPPGFAGDDSSSYCSDGSQCGGPTPTPTRTKLNKARRFLHRGRDDQGGALSDSECQPMSWRHRYLKDANSNDTKVLASVKPLLHPQTGTKLFDASSSPPSTTNKNGCSLGSRASSLNLGKDSQRYRHDKFHHAQDQHFNDDKICSVKRDDKVHKSFRHQPREDTCVEVKIRKETTTTMTKEVIAVYRDEKSRSPSSELVAISQEESSSTVASRDSDQEEDSPRHNKGGGGGGGGGGNVVRWHSFQRGSLYPEALDPLCSRAMASMSCGQLLVLRKLALLKLTASMERYCPTHRTGWNWELPKFIRKIKSPDYKDKTVFGVPLLVSLQRTGQALPKSIQIALRWLRANALDQVGIFRKSGVRSRIQKLKVMTETQGDAINFDGQQAFDVADLVKQYFRELPEALLTNKLSETFIAIFQHVPVELRPDAVQSVLLLLPDEHREALETLVDFLNHVASNSPYNQMTASNLAVCLAPSLFHFNHSNPNVTNRSSSVSPRRRKTVGIPDQRELSENKAAHDCLLYLIKMHRELFMVSSDMLTQCHFNYMEESVPVALEELGTEMKQDWRGYLYACTTALFKEAREKSRGWVTVNNPADTSVEMAYKKVGDGHPLRLWRVSTEVEAPPNELLHRVLRERHIWDPQLLKYRLVDKLDTNAEIFQYAAGNMSPLPARDYCVLRSWRNDLPKGACVVVETSVEHPDAQVMLGGTRGIVLASRYLIEPCGSGKSRIMHLSRVDTKGRTPEWYNKSYGHIAALHLSKIRNSFKHTTDGPESKV